MVDRLKMDWYGRDMIGHERSERLEGIPENILPIIESLNELDSVKREELYESRSMGVRRRFTGKQILQNAKERGLFGPSLLYPQGISINTIPPLGRRGSCADVLLVAIGEADNFELRILEAIEHCGVLCRGITRYIVFYAFKWDDIIWKVHEESFKLIGTVIVLKPFGRPPIRLV